MLSRSSSSYQPLAQAVVGETVTPAIPRRNFSGHNASIRVQVTEDNDINYEENHEMSSIAIISKHPLRVGTTPTVATLTNPGSSGAAGLDPRVDIDLSFSNLERRRKDGSWNWTNFHFIMCIGVVGFLIFWFMLLSRMYLPVEYQFWAKPKS